LRLPDETVAGYVTVSSTAKIIGLITGRNMLLKNLKYDVIKDGLINAPEISMFKGENSRCLCPC